MRRTSPPVRIRRLLATTEAMAMARTQGVTVEGHQKVSVTDGDTVADMALLPDAEE